MIWPVEPGWWAALLAVHAAATWFMAGLIWFVQIVHYPMLVDRADARFVATQHRHQQRTGYVVALPMALELLTAILLLLVHPHVQATGPMTDPAISQAAADAAGVSSWALSLGLVLVLVNVGMTAAVFVPLHQKLTQGYEQRIADQLVKRNWVRTVIWTVRAGLVAAWLST